VSPAITDGSIGTGPVLAVEWLTTSFRVDGAWKSVVNDVWFTIDAHER